MARDLCSSGTPEEQLLTKPTTSPKPNINEDHDQERGDLCHSDIPEWLQEFRENLVDDRVPEHGDSHATTQWIQAYPCKNKTSQETQRSLHKFLEPNRKPKVIYTGNSLEFGKACEDLSWNHCTSTPHRSETNGIAERAVRRVKRRYTCSIVAMRSG